ncbi:hypothetical protein CKF54_01590 [Psittacicella hinzii]|uniref:Octanoyltransferase n=2 Tax=Psittacicella hinzii TaxID=2028575 RepID=A0A3A1Y9G4_9GAMM|nr:hypothetical protein CKF54_01590 [Psittacicella hinzii]
MSSEVCSKVIVQRYHDLVNWEESFKAMVDFTHNRTSQTIDQILVLEHQPVFTQGINGNASHILNNRFNIPVMQADRGGQVTYHGPRQLIVYLLIDFERKKKQLADFDIKFYARNIVTAMEQAVVNILTHLGIKNAHAKPDAPGIYIDEKKVSSLGIKITRQGTYHGIAINLDMDLLPFNSINPCGYAGLEMCNLVDFLDPKVLNDKALFTQDSLNEDYYTSIQKLVSEYFVSYIANCFAYSHIYELAL